MLAACAAAGLPRAVVVVGARREQLIEHLKARPKDGLEVSWAVQDEQRGTGHALLCALPAIDAGGPPREIVVLCGDAPLLRPRTVRDLLAVHREGGAAATILTADLPDPTGYGRVIRGPAGDVEKIVEHRDATEAERRVKEINSADYVFDLAAVRSARGLPDLRAALAQEYALVEWFGRTQPDLVEGIRAQVVDKDRDPRWSPATLADVAPDLGARALAYVPAEPLWDS